MATIQYPEGLPCPRLLDTQAVDRRQLTQGVGPMQARPVQLGLVIRETLAFTFTYGQAEEFRAWWADTLNEGGAWFLARWPTPEGLQPGRYGMRRFTRPPAWSEFIAGVGWGMTIEAELASAGAVPQETAPEYVDIGWLEPAIFPWIIDPASASTENSAVLDFSEVKGFSGGVVGNLGHGPEVSFFLASWEPLWPNDPAPIVANLPSHYGVFTVTFPVLADPESETGVRIASGVARIRLAIQGRVQEGQTLIAIVAAIDGYYAAVEYFHVEGNT